MSSREKVRFGKIMLTGVPKGPVGSDILVLLEDGLGNALFATGTTVPNAVSGYAKGCLFIDTNKSGVALYCNKSDSLTSCTFSLVTQA
jgi:hypothetical protein